MILLSDTIMSRHDGICLTELMRSHSHQNFPRFLGRFPSSSIGNVFSIMSFQKLSGAESLPKQRLHMINDLFHFSHNSHSVKIFFN